MNFPEQKMTEYETAIRSFCHDNPETTIYLAGGISHPGISDLDFIVIDKEPVVNEYVKPFLAGGNVIIMPREKFALINSIERFSLKKIQGEDLRIDKPTDDEGFHIVEVIEWLPERILKCKSLDANSACRRHALLLHKSICRSIRNVERITGLCYGSISVDEARQSDKIHTGLLMEDSIVAGCKAWKGFEEYLRDSSLISGAARGRVDICEYYSFSNKFEMLLLYFDAMTRIDTRLSKSLSKRCSIETSDASFSDEIISFLTKRWHDLDDIFCWFDKNNLKRGMVKYGWLL
jgi:hypothetical protein